MDFKSIIVEQRKELETIEKEEGLVLRENLESVGECFRYPNILVVMGIRRCGKSIFSYQVAKKKVFGYVNFDDERLAGVRTEDLNGILEALYDLYQDLELIVLDEIQNVDGWELFANRLRRTKRVIIAGSNTKMLEGELATKLTGRYVDITMFPFSFKEFLELNGVDAPPVLTTEDRARVMNALADYMETGGFPEIKKMGKALVPLLYDNILAKDILSRHKINKKLQFRQLAKFLISNHSQEFSYSGLSRTLGIRHVSTISNWVSYLKEAFLVFELERFDYKLKQQFKAPKKIYCTDSGIITAIGFSPAPNRGRMIENIVAIQLQRLVALDRSIEVYYWKDHQQNEVDFVLKRRTQVFQLIQVTYANHQEDIRERELRALLLASKHLRCKDLLVITWNYEGAIEFKGQMISFKPLWKWLLSK